MGRLFLTASAALIFVVVTTVQGQEKPAQDLTWAFPQLVPQKDLKPVDDDGKPRRILRSTKEYTQKQIDDLFNAPDWFPDEHSPFPKVVQFGKAPIVQACAKCHLANGKGHPESASLTGLSAPYMIRQMFDLKNDVRKDGEPMNMVLYDLTSVYFEGRHRPLAKLGHSRDDKSGKLQMVIGLLTNRDGCPIAVEVFEGNTGDPKTVAGQIAKIRERFGIQRVVLVGDRGVLTSARIREDLKPTEGIDWITALRALSIQQLVESGSL